MSQPGEFTSFIRTGGTLVHLGMFGGRWWRAKDDPPYLYKGGTLEPGRFTSKLAPVSSDPLAAALRRDRLAFREYPAPRYDTPAEVTKRCHEAGTGAYLPTRGEEAGVKFIWALRALGPGWERPMLTAVETPWGRAPWRVPAPVRKLAARRKGA